ncbi:ribosome biogenesis GTPase Der [Candidatus Uhrbacteria bacterium]|nr:ribosome biogenesis GTPase Der [Candidatus Uhrbacteria bacterium]
MPDISQKETEQYPLVVLVGRVNVGKSTLFNLFTEKKKAVTAPVPGTTRDINYGFCRWRDQEFFSVDTGGYIPKPKTDIEKRVAAQAENMLTRATVILFMVDTREGLHTDDKAYIKVIRKRTKAPVILVGNKADSRKARGAEYDRAWLTLGLGEPRFISAISGSGTGDILDEVITYFPQKKISEKSFSEPIKIAIIGRTNVGKSSLLNGILGEERVIVSAIPHTTREPQDTPIEYQGVPLLLIDTVGIRKKSRVKRGIEREGVGRSIRNIEKADICILILDSTVTPSKQEKRLAEIAVQSGAGIILAVNKWDLIEGKQTKTPSAFEQQFREYFSFISWAPIVFVSALTGKRVQKILPLALSVEEERKKIISPEECGVFIKRAIARQKPQWIMGYKKPVIYGFGQRSSRPPTFALFVQEAKAISYAYLRYIENRLREQYGFLGTPVRVCTEQRLKKDRVDQY